ncbi:MAG: VWA domain-containing protein [Fidelibacterota bacterium]
MIVFRYPEFLYLTIPLAFLWLVWALKGRRQQLLRGTVPELRNRLFGQFNAGNRKWKQRLTLWSWVFLLLAASGPQIGTRLTPVERKGVDLVFAIDVSTSMNAEDVKPSRLEKAKFEISQMIRQLKGDRVAIIIFAGSSHLYLPLTTDYEAALLFLENIDTNMIQTQGTALSMAIRTGLSAFSEESKKYKVLVLVTDGEDHEGQAVELAAEAAKKGMVIHTVGVGTVSGSLIPLFDSAGIKEYKRDNSGKLITTVLNESILKDIADAGNGDYIRFDNRPANYKKLLSDIGAMEKRTIQSRVYSEFEDRYQIFAFIALILILLGILLPTKPRKIQDWRGRFVQ